MEYLSE